jgi:hypothetical protein
VAGAHRLGRARPLSGAGRGRASPAGTFRRPSRTCS